MSTVALFLAIVAVIAIVAILFACYQSRLRARELQAVAQEQARNSLNEAVVFSGTLTTPDGHTAVRTAAGRLRHKFPTPAPIIRNLPTLFFDSSTIGPGEKDEEPPTCVICFCEYEDQDKIKLLPCLHQYHEECIDAWLQRDHICPVCQADVILAAGLSLHDWSAHTQAAVDALSGSRAQVLVTLPDAPADDGNPSIYEPETPSPWAPDERHVQAAAPDSPRHNCAPSAAAAAAGSNGPAMQSSSVSLQQRQQRQDLQQLPQPAVARYSTCRCQMRAAQQQLSDMAPNSSSTVQHPGPVHASSDTAATPPSSVADDTCVVIRPSWFLRGRTATSSAIQAAAGSSNPASPNAGSSSSREVLSTPISPVTPAAAAAAAAAGAAGSSATSDAAHVVLTIRQGVDGVEPDNSR